jgi:hypothetical protein
MTSFLKGTSLFRETTLIKKPFWLIAILFSLAHSVGAELTARIEEIEFTLGQDVTIKWDGGKDPVSIQLLVQQDDGNFGGATDIASKRPFTTSND